MHHRRYDATLYGKFPGLDYSHPQPFRNWRSEHLSTLIGGWLAGNPPCLELATLAQSELRSRSDDLASSMKFTAFDLAPIGWLDAARQAIQTAFPARILEQDKKGRLGGSLYVILRGGYSEMNGWYGVYVGSIRRTVDKRFREHRTSSRAGRGLIAHGIEPLYSLFDHLNPMPVARKSLIEWETRLHEALAPVVPKVTGDVAF